ncbi:MAG: hypothetical protein M3P98_03930 [bacterium]|nr:hypothetical protein [bacterium]
MKKLNNNGIAHIALILGIVVALLIIVIGWLVYDRNKTDYAPKDVVSTQTEEPVDESISKDWIVATSGKGAFSVKVPDGWTITNDTESDNMFIRGADNTVFNTGTRATINNITGFGFDGPSRLTILNGDPKNIAFLDGSEKEIGSFEAANISGKKLFKTTPVEPIDGIGDLPGQETTYYQFEKDGKLTLVVYTRQTANEFNSIAADEADILETVDAMVATLTIN